MLFPNQNDDMDDIDDVNEDETLINYNNDDEEIVQNNDDSDIDVQVQQCYVIVIFFYLSIYFML